MAKENTQTITSAEKLIEHELTHIKNHWGWFFALGILLIVGGMAALAAPALSSLWAVLVLGIILIVGGIFTIIGAFWAGKWSAFFLQVLIGILYLVVGIAIRDTPKESLELLSLFVAAFFIVAGAFRIVVALLERFPKWGWALLNGVLTLLIGIIIYDALPQSTHWAIGILVGVELLFNGWTWVMLSLALRDAPLPEESDS
jgi:uncharacterized membrane protein HdeD (DUF308 family)